MTAPPQWDQATAPFFVHEFVDASDKPMDGFLSIDKPAGLTSRDVVNRIQRLLRPAKVGHAGTLDPLATGVLVLAIGKATRLVQFVQRMPKHYHGAFRLGCTSDTEDVTGDVVPWPHPKTPSPADVEAACRGFVGEIQQRPPSYSALKVQGRRAYDLARRGQPVELPARPVSIHRLAVRRFDYPELELEVVCGGGTYLRSLGRDIGEALGCGAVMSALRRTAIGTFDGESARPLTDVASREDVRTHLCPLELGLKSLPQVVVAAPQQAALAFGQPIHLDAEPPPEEAVALDDAGQPLAVLARMSDGRYRPSINLRAANR